MRVSQILSVKDVESQFGPQKLVRFRVDGNPNVISSYFKPEKAPSEGSTLDGEIVAKESNGTTFYNFKAARKSFGGGGVDPRTAAEVLARLDRIIELLEGRR